MPKKYNDIDTAMIERADHFEASIFLGVGAYRSESHPTLEAARAAAVRLKTEVNNGRRGMVYAVTPEGRSTFVPDRYQPTPKGDTSMTTATETKLSGVQIAQLTAILLGESAFKRSNSKEAAIKRFTTVAAEKGIEAEDAAKYLGYEFDLAEHVIRERIEGKAMSIPEVQAKRPAEETAPTEPKADKPTRAPKTTGKRAAILEAAQRGELPAAPDFSAETHKRFRPKLAQVVAMAEAGDLKALKAFEINPVSSSPKAIAKYRDLCVIALEARATKGEAA